MTTIGPFDTSPCADPIDQVYNNGLMAYKNEVEELQQAYIEYQNELKEKKEKKKELTKAVKSMHAMNAHLKEELNIVERTNHHIDNQLKSIHKYLNSLTTKETQTSYDDFLLAKEENIDLTNQIQDLIALIDESLKTQQLLINKTKKKEAKIAAIKKENEKLSNSVQVSHKTEENLFQKITEETSKKIQLKTDNKRLALRLAETEGNLEESSYINTRLREKLDQASSKKSQMNGEEILKLTSDIIEKESIVHDLEYKLTELEQTKRQLLDAQDEFQELDQQYQTLSNSLIGISKGDSIVDPLDE